MDAYTSFSEVYDLFMDNVPYEDWGNNIKNILKKYKIKEGLVCDLGCGTGKMTRLLSKDFDMIGIDNSIEMLEIAREHETSESDKSILYLLQDMREFELYGTVAAVVSVCDSMNYILSEDDLLSVFKLANNYLDPGGIFLFDMNTLYKYENLLAENTFAENREEGSFIWENFYDEESMINEYDLTLYIANTADFCQQPEAGDSQRLVENYSQLTELMNSQQPAQVQFQRFEEVHYQKAYEISTIKMLIEESGLELLDIIDVDTMSEPTETTERIYVVARERMK